MTPKCASHTATCNSCGGAYHRVLPPVASIDLPTWHVTLGRVLLAAAIGLVAGGARAARVGALVDLCIGVAQLDRNVALQLVLETNLGEGGRSSTARESR